MNKIMGILTMCRRAGKLEMGMDQVKGACGAKIAKIVCVVSDFSEKSLKEIKFVCGKFDVPLYSLDMTLEEVQTELGKKVGVIAVCDGGFAKSVASKLDKIELENFDSMF